MNNYKVTLKNADGEKCHVTIYDCDSIQIAKEEAELERGHGWMAIDCKEVK